MSNIKHAAIRIYLYFLLFIFFISGGLSLFIFAPLYKGAFAPSTSYKSFNPLVIWLHIYKIMWRSISNKSYRDLYPQRLTDEPQYSNACSMRIKESWQGSADNCDMCSSSCCAQIKCPMFKGKRCLSYGSLYFGYLYCGRYPSNQGQIDLYDCPKWEVSTE